MRLFGFPEGEPHPRLKALADEGRVSERVISYKGQDNILLTTFENTEDIGSQMYKYAQKISKNRLRDHGGSILSDAPAAERKHAWVQFNVTQPMGNIMPQSVNGGERLLFTFIVLRWADLINRLQFVLKSNPTEEYEVIFKVIRKTPPTFSDEVIMTCWYHTRTSQNKFTLPMEPPIDFTGDAEYRVSVEIPSSKFAEWMDMETICSCVIMGDEDRKQPQGGVRIRGYPIEDGSDKYLEVLQPLADQGRVTEEVVSYRGYNDILMTKIDNDTVLNTTHFVVATVNSEARTSEFGGSLLSDEPGNRKYIMVQGNHIETKRTYFQAKPGHNGRMFVYYLIPRYAELCDRLKVTNPAGAATAVSQESVKVDIVRESNYIETVCHPSCIMNTSEQEIRLFEPLEFYRESRTTFFVRVDIPSSQFANWMEIELSTTLTYMGDKLRDEVLGRSTASSPTELKATVERIKAKHSREGC